MRVARRLQRRRHRTSTSSVDYLPPSTTVNKHTSCVCTCQFQKILLWILLLRRGAFVRDREARDTYVYRVYIGTWYDIIMGSATDLTLCSRVRHNIMTLRTTIGIKTSFIYYNRIYIYTPKYITK